MLKIQRKKKLNKTKSKIDPLLATDCFRRMMVIMPPSVCRPPQNTKCNDLDMMNCGDVCANSNGNCVMTWLTRAMELVFSIIGILTSGLGTAAIQAIKQGAKFSVQVVVNSVKNALKDFIKEGTKNIIKYYGITALTNIGLNLCEPLKTLLTDNNPLDFEKLIDFESIKTLNVAGTTDIYYGCSQVDKSDQQKLKCVRGLLTTVSLFDPSGITGLATAFMQDYCPPKEAHVKRIPNHCVRVFEKIDFEGSYKEICPEFTNQSKIVNVKGNSIATGASVILRVNKEKIDLKGPYKNDNSEINEITIVGTTGEEKNITEYFTMEVDTSAKTQSETNEYAYYDRNLIGRHDVCLEVTGLDPCYDIEQSDQGGIMIGAYEGNKIWLKKGIKRPKWCFSKKQFTSYRSYRFRANNNKLFLDFKDTHKVVFENGDWPGHEIIYIGNDKDNNSDDSYYYCRYSNDMYTNLRHNDQFRCSMDGKELSCCGYDVKSKEWMTYKTRQFTFNDRFIIGGGIKIDKSYCTISDLMYSGDSVINKK